jgi:hypothetical protein
MGDAREWETEDGCKLTTNKKLTHSIFALCISALSSNEPPKPYVSNPWFHPRLRPCYRGSQGLLGRKSSLFHNFKVR